MMYGTHRRGIFLGLAIFNRSGDHNSSSGGIELLACICEKECLINVRRGIMTAHTNDSVGHILL